MLFFLYLLAAYLRPVAIRLCVGLLTLVAGAGVILTASLAFPTPGLGPLLTGISFGLQRAGRPGRSSQRCCWATGTWWCPTSAPVP